jgi:hypothetical protein
LRRQFATLLHGTGLA